MSAPDSQTNALRELILQATARGWCDPANSSKEMDADLAVAIAAEVEKAVDEHFAMKFAAIMTASIQNTPKSIKDRIGPDNPYWTVAYGDVCTAIDREMKLLAAQQGGPHNDGTAHIDHPLRHFDRTCLACWQESEAGADDAPDYKALHTELIMAVARKYPGETRHQTALRYINEAERQPQNADQASKSNATDRDGGSNG